MSIDITNLMADMTLAEKIGQLNLVTPGGDTLTGTVTNEGVADKVRKGQIGGIFGIKTLEAVRAFQDLAMEGRLKIPLMFAEDVIHGHRTIFPIPLGIASTWNMTLIEETARIAAKEASAEGIDQVYAPVIDVARDPRWGRIAESPGEDPYFASRYAEAFVRGLQGKTLSDSHSVMSCLKHFAAYGAAEGGRDYDGVDLSPAKLHDVYMPPFIAGIKAGAGSLMAAFNTVNGMPMHAHAELINQVLRATYGFSGLVVSDYTGVLELLNHRIAKAGRDAAVLGIGAGVDADMVSELYLTTLEDSVREGLLDEAVIDAACRRVLEAKQALGLFHDPYRRMTSQPVALEKDHLALSRQAAAESCVLLKNDNQILPLKKSMRVALIGPLADDQVNMNGTWAVSGDPDNCVTLLEGMRSVSGKRGKIFYGKGANIVDDAILASRLNVHNPHKHSVTIDQRTAQEMIDEAIALAEKSDVIVAVVGEAKEYSGEASSRVSIDIPEEQKKLLRALKETGKPLVALIMTGRPLVLTEEAGLADAMMVSWFGGTEAGNGIADILYSVVNPSGKLTATFPYHEGQIPVYHSHEPTGRPYEGRFQKFRNGYIDMPDSVSHKAGLYPFGYGLSYTHFRYDGPRIALSDTGDEVQIETLVTNTGKKRGQETVQLYVTDPIARLSRPVQELKGFEKIDLQPGESRNVVFTVRREDLSYSIAQTLGNTARLWEEGDFTFSTGPHSQKLQGASLYWRAPSKQKFIEYCL